MKKHSFMTVELSQPNQWGVFCDGETLHTSTVVHLLYEQQDKIMELEDKLVKHYALVSMLEDCLCKDIDDIIYDSRDFKSEEHYNTIFEKYLKEARQKITEDAS